MRRVGILSVTALVAVLATGCGTPPKPDGTPDPPELRVLVAGDSLAEGYYASQLEQGLVPVLAAELAPTAYVDPVLATVSGARAFRVAARVETVTAGADPVDVAVLEVGANDVGKSTLPEWTEGYQRLLDAVAATSPDATVVCLGPWNAPRASRPYETVVRRLCRDHVYLRLSDLYATAGLRGPAGRDTFLGTSDDFHPNDAGHAVIAERVATALEE